MNHTVTFDPQHQIWEAAAKDDARPALSCVLIDPSGVLVATDGLIMGMVKANVGDLDKPVVVRAEAFKVAVEQCNHDRDARAQLTINMKQHLCSIDMKTHTSVWSFYNGTFPDWRTFIPDFSKLTFGLPVSGYSPRLAERAAAIVGGQGITGAGLGSAYPFIVVAGGNEALAVVMPMFFLKLSVMESIKKTYQNLGISTATA